jgi:hypothetical protein
MCQLQSLFFEDFSHLTNDRQNLEFELPLLATEANECIH